MQSIISKDNKCYICGNPNNLETHHCIFGSKRRLADEDGLTVKLCFKCHHNLHHNVKYKPIQEELKQKAQECWEAKYGTRGMFIVRYGRNYL